MTNITSGSAVMTLEEIIAYHLEYNFEVPFPISHIPLLVPLCVEAIKLVNSHNLRAELSLPDGINMVDNEGKEFNKVYAYEIVALCRLDKWLNAEWF